MTNQDLFMLTPEEREELRKREAELDRVGPVGEYGPVGPPGCPGVQGPEAPHGVWVSQMRSSKFKHDYEGIRTGVPLWLYIPPFTK